MIRFSTCCLYPKAVPIGFHHSQPLLSPLLQSLPLPTSFMTASPGLVLFLNMFINYHLLSVHRSVWVFICWASHLQSNYLASYKRKTCRTHVDNLDLWERFSWFGSIFFQKLANLYITIQYSDLPWKTGKCCYTSHDVWTWIIVASIDCTHASPSISVPHSSLLCYSQLA